MAELIFNLKGVHYSYLGKFSALCGIDLEIKRGEKIAILGANGTGKSTLLQVLDGLTFPDKGHVEAFGAELSESAFGDKDFSRNFRKKVGFVFQNADVQLFCPTVEEDIVFGPLQLGIPKEQIKERLKLLAEILNIGSLLERSPHQLSVGEKRRVAIATTLVIEPEVIIFDEPTAGLDPQTTRHVMDIIIQANAEGRTIITATHDLHIVEEIADTVYVLGRDRKIFKEGPARVLLSDTELLRQNNLIHIHAHRHKGELHVHPHEHLEHHP